MSGNPGVNEETHEHIKKRIKCRSNELIMRFNRIEQKLRKLTANIPMTIEESVKNKV